MGNECTLKYVAPIELENSVYRIARACSWKRGTPGIQIFGGDGNICGGITEEPVDLIRVGYDKYRYRSYHYKFAFPDECIFPGRKEAATLKYYLEEKTPYLEVHTMKTYRISYLLPYHSPGNIKLDLEPKESDKDISVCGAINHEKLYFTYHLNSMKVFDGRYYVVVGRVSYFSGKYPSETDRMAYTVDNESGVIYPALPCGDEYDIIGNVKCFNVIGESFKVSFASPKNNAPKTAKFRIALNTVNGYGEFSLDSGSCGSIA